MNAAIDIPAEVKAPVFRVAIENIAALWPSIMDLVDQDLAGIPTYEPDDIRHILLSNRAHLWIQWSDHVEAFVITDFVSYPRGLALRAWLGAARREDRFNRELFHTELFRWARRNECRWVEGCGRIGWLKIFPDTKYAGMFMRADVDKDYQS